MESEDTTLPESATLDLDGLDAMTTAPDHHTLLVENERVRVLDSLLKPGESTPIKTFESFQIRFERILASEMTFQDLIRCQSTIYLLASSKNSMERK